MVPIQPDQAWEDLQGRMEDNPQIQVWKLFATYPEIAAKGATTKY